ncbi:doublecortin domain-containing protein 2B [Notechis scutatus]|uniref:Doublecortin domain-containing protein 2B n=1 Tax=Notechis scutatus TaxID=8663 RepID=A0A6J1UF04_9SAUR|nr:doublecortin domain-containing protein 2B [Notechis scutatus]
MVSGTVAVAPLAKNVVVFRNGDPFFLGRKFVVSRRRFLTFDAFLNEVTSTVQAPVAIRSIYTPRGGHRIMELSELQNGCRYVAAGFERFKRLDYANVGMKQLNQHQKKNGAQNYPGVPQKVMVTAGWKRQTNLPCVIYVFRNGDLLSPPFRMVLARSALQEWGIILSRLSEKANLHTGVVKKNFPANRRSYNQEVVSEDVASDSALLEPAQQLKPWRVHSTGIMPAGDPPRPSESRAAKKYPHQDKATSVFHAKPSQVRQVSQGPGNYSAQEDESVYKRRGGRQEMADAQEIGEDENTQVELPVDQKAAEIVEEEVISKIEGRPSKKGL